MTESYGRTFTSLKLDVRPAKVWPQSLMIEDLSRAGYQQKNSPLTCGTIAELGLQQCFNIATSDNATAFYGVCDILKCEKSLHLEDRKGILKQYLAEMPRATVFGPES